MEIKELLIKPKAFTLWYFLYCIVRKKWPRARIIHAPSFELEQNGVLVCLELQWFSYRFEHSPDVFLKKETPLGAEIVR